MKILVTAPGEFMGDDLVPGEYYNAEPAVEGTDAQRKTFFALCQCYYVSGCHSYNAMDFKSFYDLIKHWLGVGYEEYWETGDGQGNLLAEPIKRKRLKSLTEYTKKQWMHLIDALIAEMEQVGVDTPKYREILKGMESAA